MSEPGPDQFPNETAGETPLAPAVRYEALAASVKNQPLNLLPASMSAAVSIRAAVREDGIESLKAQAELERLKARTRAYEQDIKLRREWSSYLKWVLGGTLGFQFGLAVSIGLGWLNYEKYGFFINAIVAENFVQLIGLCYIVVNYLFPRPANAVDQPLSNTVPTPPDDQKHQDE